MLMIQPKISNNYGPSFRADNSDLDQEEIEYNKTRNELLNQKKEFEDMLDSGDFKMLKPAEKFVKGGAIITTGLLGGMAGGWGARKTIQGCAKLYKSAPATSLKKQIKSGFSTIKRVSSKIKQAIVESNPYQVCVDAFKKQYNKFAENKIGKKIVNAINYVSEKVKVAYTFLKGCTNKIVGKFKNIPNEKYENATVNTIGVSSGLAASAQSIKDKSEAGEL